MGSRHTRKQEEQIDYLDATFLLPKKVSALDLAITQQPKLFSKTTKKDRHFNNCVDYALKDLKLLDFFLTNLKPYYRLKILKSVEFQNLIQNVFDVSVGKFYRYTKEEKEITYDIGIQILGYCLELIGKNTPSEFIKPLKRNIEPLSELLKSIYESSRKNNVKELPKFRDIVLPFT